jgi:hypothetical protein
MVMKNTFISILIIAAIIAFSCKKEEVESTNFKNLTSHIWVSDSLLVEGEDASGPGEMLEIFNGEVVLKKDGTGTFGVYNGTWYFTEEETKIVLASDSLGFPLTTNIEELTNISLKITTAFPSAIDPENPINIRMTFNAK